MPTRNFPVCLNLKKPVQDKFAKQTLLLFLSNPGSIPRYRSPKFIERQVDEVSQNFDYKNSSVCVTL